MPPAHTVHCALLLHPGHEHLGLLISTILKIVYIFMLLARRPKSFSLLALLLDLAALLAIGGLLLSIVSYTVAFIQLISTPSTV
jgi:hypothetical protein